MMMNVLKKILNQLMRHDLLWRSIIVLAILFIVYLCYQLSPVYSALLKKIWAVARPFVIAFMIAYILNPLVQCLENLGIKRGLAIVLVYVVFLLSLFFLIGILLPAVLANVSQLSASLIETVQKIQEHLLVQYQIDASELSATFIDSISKLTENLSLIENTFNAFNEALGYLTSGIIYLAVSSYILVGFDYIKAAMKRFAKNIHYYVPSYLSSLDYYMQAFLKGMVTLMLIRLIEYGLMYLIIGHTYWKEMAVLSGVSVFVPYVGALFSSAIGALTGFGLPPVQFIVMMLLMIILFFVDSYIVLPDVYSKEINTHPIWILFAMITGLNLFGFKGLLLSIPIFIAFRVAYLEIIFFTKESV